MEIDGDLVIELPDGADPGDLPTDQWVQCSRCEVRGGGKGGARAGARARGTGAWWCMRSCGAAALCGGRVAAPNRSRHPLLALPQTWRVVPSEWWPAVQADDREDWFCEDAQWDVAAQPPRTPACDKPAPKPRGGGSSRRKR